MSDPQAHVVILGAGHAVADRGQREGIDTVHRRCGDREHGAPAEGGQQRGERVKR